MRRDVTKVGVFMSEIKSDASIVEEYVTGIRTANSILASDNSTMTEDDITNLAVNGNGTELYELSKQAIAAISSQISDDCNRILSVAGLFEEKDIELARGK